MTRPLGVRERINARQENSLALTAQLAHFAIKKTTKLQAQNSRMAAHHIAKYIRHAPVSKPHVDPKVKWGAKFLGATMWFYIFYRVKEDFIGGHH
ncbi:hypothetical protein EJF18_70308 [Clavispora lusitaniae]|uniref:Uncharacterized protein n=1 Tax=Clavispora lusitaniae TaxID=36911 RepID=A0ACD0WSG1_CLALS|nr:hypothetical protein EJF14_70308 [Clavispora lusitaniae]QFZ35894.1 hypothetical protein EJF16_70308 [Clavispora lusitaniae]QFZ41576.1 hypothetical protein EJF15_70308 [Clavispora lusitaniae]QFZ47254.1 hypothetical protein EJF18_70308 [Clavispora lusitaniae]QFZ52931.1 hypothetical protein EJF17_70308 [Clavispora lusitaniae]